MWIYITKRYFYFILYNFLIGVSNLIPTELMKYFVNSRKVYY